VARITRDDVPLPSSTRNPGIIPSDDPGEALSLGLSSTDIHLSIYLSGIHCTLWPQYTNVTDRPTDGHWHHSISMTWRLNAKLSNHLRRINFTEDSLAVMSSREFSVKFIRRRWLRNFAFAMPVSRCRLLFYDFWQWILLLPPYSRTLLCNL